MGSWESEDSAWMGYLHSPTQAHSAFSCTVSRKYSRGVENAAAGLNASWCT